jgi:hypothetical protein
MHTPLCSILDKKVVHLMESVANDKRLYLLESFALEGDGVVLIVGDRLGMGTAPPTTSGLLTWYLL